MICDDHSDHVQQSSRSLTSLVKMGGGASVKAKPRATTPEEVKILIREACNDKKKVEAVLVHIKDMRSEMSNKNIDIGESRLSRLHQVEEEKAELLNRLSSLASDRMRNKNPKIADLSDTNRPTKLTERFSELYDNEWTDAFTKLRDLNHVAERTAIEILLLILKNCYTTCKKIAKKQCQELGDKFFSPKEREGPSFELRINECQKQIAQITYIDLQQGCKGLIEDSITSKEDEERIMEYLRTEPDLKYVKSCIELTWLMCIQAPPVILKFEPGEKEISEYFRTYTKSGDKPDFVVWPVLFLHEKGPVLSKGVIQFKVSERSDQKSSNMKSKDKANVISSKEQAELKVPKKKITPENNTTESKGQIGSQNNEEKSTNSSVNQDQETTENTHSTNASKNGER